MGARYFVIEVIKDTYPDLTITYIQITLSTVILSLIPGRDIKKLFSNNFVTENLIDD